MMLDMRNQVISQVSSKFIFLIKITILWIDPVIKMCYEAVLAFFFNLYTVEPRNSDSFRQQAKSHYFEVYL